MAKQWQQIDKLIKEAEQDYLKSVPKPSKAEQQRLKAQHSDPFMYRQDLNIEGYDAVYFHIKKYLEDRGVVWDDALKDRIVTYFAKRHPIKSRTEYVTAGIKDSTDVFGFSISSDVYKKQQELFDENKGSETITKEQAVSLGAQTLLNPLSYIPIGKGATLASVFGYSLYESIFSSNTSKNLTAGNPIVAPEWMYKQRGINSFCNSDEVKLKSSYNWAIKNAKNYEKLRDSLYAENKDVYKRKDGTTGSVKELDLRAKEYRLFANQCKHALGMNDIKSELPVDVSKLSNCSDQELQNAANFVNRKLEWCQSKAQEKVKKNEFEWKDKKGKVHTILEYDILLKEYSNYGKAVQKEIDVRIARQQEELEQQQRQQVYSSVPNTSYQTEQRQQNSEAQSNVTSKTEKQWGGLLDTLGLSGFGDVTNNLGYVFSILPDILCAMFTGQMDKLKLKDNILPIASILMGMFISNPILKMMMIGLGGANLLNKGVHEAMEKEDEQQQRNSGRVYKYDTLTPEPLNKRVSSPEVNGDIVVMQIDGKPYCVTIDANTASLYKQGMIPLNNLCNKIVSIYDRQGESQSAQQSQNIAITETQERSRGLR